MAKPKKAETAPEIPKEHSEEAIAAKMASGLSHEQAIAVLDAQAAHDATDPHDEAPDSPWGATSESTEESAD